MRIRRSLVCICVADIYHTNPLDCMQDLSNTHGIFSPDAALHATGLMDLMRLSSGRPAISVALVDGPVATDHPDLAGRRFINLAGTATPGASEARDHGTFIAGMLAARDAPPIRGICPDCTFLLHPLFGAEGSRAGVNELAQAIVQAVKAGANVINLSLGIECESNPDQGVLTEALHFATARGTLVVAAAGNQARVGRSMSTGSDATIIVSGADLQGKPAEGTNLSASGALGIAAPAAAVGLSPASGPVAMAGTSVATVFVTGTIALLRSVFPQAGLGELRRAVTGWPGRPRSLAPPLLDAMTAFKRLAATHKPTLVQA